MDRGGVDGERMIETKKQRLREKELPKKKVFTTREAVWDHKRVAAFLDESNILVCPEVTR